MGTMEKKIESTKYIRVIWGQRKRKLKILQGMNIDLSSLSGIKASQLKDKVKFCSRGDHISGRKSWKIYSSSEK